ncbi:MAG: exo-alpha-sialidase [Clostridia bacterium]|nr:exo-alpha-sialidase [Clostridia bacterium]
MNVINKIIIETSKEYSQTESNAYPFYRIPCIVSDKNGVMYVCYECRQGSDWSVIDICMRRSCDGGKSWTDRFVVADGMGRNACNNPTLICDDNVLYLLYCENYKRMFYKTSTDGGDTWTSPTEITDIFDSFHWSCIAVGPGHGIVFKGKLIAPVWLAFNQKEMFSHHPSRIAVISSEDNGQAWTCSSLLEDTLTDPSESCIGMLSEDTVLLNIRNENSEHCRAFSFSCDGVQWSSPTLQLNLTDPVCCAGMCNAEDKLMFVNCFSAENREHLCLHVSKDHGQSWSHYPIDESGGYSDICYNKKTGTAFVLYESNDCRYMKVAELDISSL